MSQKAIFERKNVIVTGGAGFIGSHLCDTLIKTCKVICVDNFSSGQESNIDHLFENPYFEFIRHNVTQPLDLEKMPDIKHFNIRFQGIQEIYHLACPTSHNEYKNMEIDTALTNALGTKNMLDVAVRYKSRFIHFSSSAIYGNPLNDEPIPEEYWGFVDPLAERAGYDEGKRFAETLVDVYDNRYKLNAKIIRIFNVYGTRMRLDSGRMIPDFVQSALKNEDLVIYGEDCRDTFCYISDLIEAALRYMKAEQPIKVLNIGNPELRPLSTIAKKVIEITGSKSRIKYAEPLLNMKKPSIPDIFKAKKFLGWFPIVRLGNGLEKTIEDMQLASKVLTLKTYQEKNEQETSQ